MMGQWSAATLIFVGMLCFGSPVTAGPVEALTGDWVGTGEFRREGNARAVPLSCRYTGATPELRVLVVRLRCATRQGANRAELRLTYDDDGRIVRAQISGGSRGIDQQVTLQQDGAGFVVRGAEEGELRVRLLDGMIEVDVNDPARGTGAVRLRQVVD